jgi:hypothetical protein
MQGAVSGIFAMSNGSSTNVQGRLRERTSPDEIKHGSNRFLFDHPLTCPSTFLSLLLQLGFSKEQEVKGAVEYDKR